MRTVNEMKKAVVLREGKHFKAGKIKHSVFHPTEPRLVGFVVHKGDTMGMIKHKDHFLAYDSFTVEDGKLHASSDADAWDEKACERLGIDYDKCIIWKAMPVVTEDGTSIGKVDDVEYDERDGHILRFITTEGALSDFLVGEYSIDGSEYVRFAAGKIVIRQSAENTSPTGGAAAKVGEAVGKAKAKAPSVAKSADETVQKGAYKLGEFIGTAKKALEPDDEDVKAAAKEAEEEQARIDAEYEAEEEREAELEDGGREDVAAGSQPSGDVQSGGESGDGSGESFGYKLGEFIGTAKQALEPDDEDVIAAAREAEEKQAQMDAEYEERVAREKAQEESEKAGEGASGNKSFGYVLGRQIRKTKVAIDEFKEEYDKESKGE